MFINVLLLMNVSFVFTVGIMDVVLIDNIIFVVILFYDYGSISHVQLA